MIEIGKTRMVTVKVKDKRTGKLSPKIGEDGQPETKIAQNEVWRVTRNSLGGTFCRDRSRRLVVGLVSLDQIAFRPQGTRQEVRANLADIYRIVLRRQADNENLARARERKAKLQERRASAAIARADRKMSRLAKANKT